MSNKVKTNRDVANEIASLATTLVGQRDYSLMINLREKGFNQNEIAELFGTTNANVSYLIKKYKSKK